MVSVDFFGYLVECVAVLSEYVGVGGSDVCGSLGSVSLSDLLYGRAYGVAVVCSCVVHSFGGYLFSG